jgi:hypothetical protein
LKTGSDIGSIQFEQCMGRQISTIQDDRRTAGRAVAAGFQSYGNSMQRNAYAPPAYRRPVNCTSNRIGDYVNTSCY